MFTLTKQLKPIEQTDLLLIAAEFAPNAFTDAGRPHYLPVHEGELAAFLAKSRMDRYVWREAQPAKDTAEMVCSSFSLLLWALLEQERLRQRVLLPLAIARIKLADHSLCGFINERGELKLIEPQNDAIYLPRPDQSLQTVTFQ